MAIFHLTAKTVARASGRSAVAAAAYRCGVRLVNERDGLAHDFRARSGVVSTFIAAPDAAPAWMLDRQALWSAAEIRETRLNAVTAREWEAALPDELDAAQREALARQFAAAMVERFGLIADCAIHAPSGEGDHRNHHLHMLTTTRSVDADGFGAKTRALDDRKTNAVEGVRELWETLTNDALRTAGSDARIDRRSLKAQAAAARVEAVSATQEAKQAAQSLNPIGKARRVERATESAQKAVQRVDGLSRPPTTHQGPERTAQRRREARAAKIKAEANTRRQRLIDGLVAAARRAELTLNVTATDYLDRLKNVLRRAGEFLDEMDQQGAAGWAHSFVARGGFLVRVFRQRLGGEVAGLQDAAGDQLAGVAARHAETSLAARAFVAWSAAAAEDDAPAAQRAAEAREKRSVSPPTRQAKPTIAPEFQRHENYERDLELSAIAMMEEAGRRLILAAFHETRDRQLSLEQARRSLRRNLNHDFGRVWPEAVQAEFQRIMTLDVLFPQPKPAVTPTTPNTQLAPESEKPQPAPPRTRGQSCDM